MTCKNKYCQVQIITTIIINHLYFSFYLFLVYINIKIQPKLTNNKKKQSEQNFRSMVCDKTKIFYKIK